MPRSKAAATGNSLPAAIEAIMGSTGCGKSTYLKKHLASKKRKRTLIWSPKEAIDNYTAFYPGTIKCSSATDVLAALQAAGKGEFHIVFEPSLNRKKDQAQFDAVCKMLLAVRNVCLVVEELHTVTLPSWSPDGWGKVSMLGRAFGLEVFALSQRPASVDKNFYGNLSKIHVGRMAFEDDARTVSKTLTVSVPDVMALKGYQWIERDILTGKVTRG